MAARLNRMHQDSVREKIKVSQIINRLQDHVKGDIELSTTQVQSARILLDKSISSLQSTDVQIDGHLTIEPVDYGSPDGADADPDPE